MAATILSSDHVGDGYDVRVAFGAEIRMIHFKAEPDEATLNAVLAEHEARALREAADAVNLNEESL